MKVRATDKYEKLNIKDEILNRIPKAGEVFEVSDERFDILNGNNFYKKIFVEVVKEDTKMKVSANNVNKNVC